MQLLAHYYDMDSGSLNLFGHPIEKYSQAQLNDQIGFVSQNVVLFHGSIRDNMKWGKEDASDQEIWQALELAQQEMS